METNWKKNGVKMDYLPEEFEIDYTFFGPGGANKLYSKGNTLIFEWRSGFPKKDFRKLELSPSEDDWIRFWSTLDKIDAWTWKERYTPPEDICADGDMYNVKISYKGQEINSYCWCNSPPGRNNFFKAIYELTDLHVDYPGGKA